jgi:hypothetical protein
MTLRFWHNLSIHGERTTEYHTLVSDVSSRTLIPNLVGVDHPGTYNAAGCPTEQTGIGYRASMWCAQCIHMPFDGSGQGSPLELLFLGRSLPYLGKDHWRVDCGVSPIVFHA